jgi:uncharacterized membrane protein YdfJ with MMPL/SSD domain
MLAVCGLGVVIFGPRIYLMIRVITRSRKLIQRRPFFTVMLVLYCLIVTASVTVGIMAIRSLAQRNDRLLESQRFINEADAAMKQADAAAKAAKETLERFDKEHPGSPQSQPAPMP